MKEEVKDVYSIVYFIFVLLGTGTLLPWNVFLTEKEFYDVRFQVQPYSPYVAQNFMSLFALAFNALNIGALALLIKVQKHLSLRVLVLQPLVITLIMLASTAALALRTEINGIMMAQFTLPSIALMGGCTALLQGGTLQLASIFSPRHIRAVVSGIAIGGVVTSTLSFVSQLRAHDSGTGGPSAEDVAPAAFMYFTASACVILACIAGYSALPLLPYGRYKLLLAGIIDDPKERKLMTVDDDYEEPLLTVVEGDGASTSTGQRVEHTRAAIISVESDYTQATRSWQHKHAFTLYCAALFFCLGLTMCIHPGISSFICSVHNPAAVSPCVSRPPGFGRLAGDLFVPLLYVLFAIGDFLGRTMSGMGPWGKGAPKPLSILTYSILRATIAGGILFCNVVTPATWQLPQYLNADWAPLAIILALGWTQGHLLSTILTHAPSTLHPSQSSRYGPVTSFAISAGCFVGSFVSLALATRFQEAP
uniref:Equilibrative nucleoside transporter n=1 Tax=Chlamydomonas leiostraca TaxID=1034604 RepID=A0A7S0WNE4_9CHLO|mmetsp:Transcript_20297/g.51394  ORF Transcript_20297/g.51394 Transcript_20297/m.51394 type:complete len:478 (+) Transcript_20297:114-1547(+)|eukprot:CAMPEP_0202862256 /NCGR_PEP_ID=MMETSP1391-20130828/3364_1 /ASSEMBLY_ACC=CAM_ASM_000867 /TAXON_ID=1034604 /ORGANISM="Chlamydomonas leiostraca, Strain SAG 11-49" /LENGTH=477 /DNA_ID=CAMNT_0049541769 /DNA_START=80 /DNA_END=1513 /DNA_ORIENTATION=-